MASNGYLTASNCLEIASALAELASMMSDAHYKWPCNLQVAHGINYCTAVFNMLMCVSAPLALLRSAPLPALRKGLYGVSISYRLGYTLCIPALGTPVHYNLNVTHSLKTAYFPEFCSPSLVGYRLHSVPIRQSPPFGPVPRRSKDINEARRGRRPFQSRDQILHFGVLACAPIRKIPNK